MELHILYKPRDLHPRTVYACDDIALKCCAENTWIHDPGHKSMLWRSSIPDSGIEAAIVILLNVLLVSCLLNVKRHGLLTALVRDVYLAKVLRIKTEGSFLRCLYQPQS